MSGVQMVTLDADADDQRLDRWLSRAFPQLTHGHIEKMCRKGEIRLDGGRVKASTRLGEGQSLRLPPLPDRSAPDRAVQGRAPKRPISDADAEMIRSAVIYRDDHIIALNKPPGLAVQGGSGQSVHVDGLAAALCFGLETAPKLVHRLDKDTSGLLLLARSGKAAAGLAKAFQSRETRKIYWAAVAGAPRPGSGTIRFGLAKMAGHGPNGAGEKMVALHPDEVANQPGAKHATTDYTVIAAAARRAAWVAMAPITGRTHQLRVHMAEIGCPIVGDGKYGTNRQTNEGDGWGAQLGGDVSRKLHLHARSLALTHPITGAPLRLEAPLAAHMRNTWDLFGWDMRDAADDPFEDL